MKGIPGKAEDGVLNLLRRIRTDAGVTQAELAARLGVPQSLVSKYESGERRLDILEVRQVCKVLGLGLVDFVRRLEKGIS